RESFPGLRADNYRETSPASGVYNCIAWALGITGSWWWPGPRWYWPEGIPREETISAFRAVFALFGFHPCEDGAPERGVEKLVLYADGEKPIHSARQLPSGKWTSKLGTLLDIEHDTAEALAGGIYGSIAGYFARPTPHPPEP